MGLQEGEGKNHPEREHTVTSGHSYKLLLSRWARKSFKAKGRQCLPSVSCLLSVTHHDYVHENICYVIFCHLQDSLTILGEKMFLTQVTFTEQKATF